MSLARGLVAQFEVVHALAMRETRTRFGAHQLGYLWALLEPVVMIMTFVVVFLIAGRSSPEGMDLFGFIATGMVPYAVFSASATQVSNAIAGNKALLFYPSVQIIDLVIARCVLELATYGLIFIVLLGSHALWLQELNIDEPLLVVAGMLFAGLLGTAFGLIFCGLAQYSAVADRARGPLMRPLFWVSGIFFTAEQLPEEAAPLLLNPVIHAVELVRAGWYPSYPTTHARPMYLLAWILMLAFAGLALERTVRRRVDLT